jgi:hypothetical protein
MLIDMTPYQLVYGKTCHLPVDLNTRLSRPFRLLNLRNGGKRFTTVPSYIKKEPKDCMTNESRPSNSSREIRYFSLTLTFIYLVMVSIVVSGKALT